MNYVHDMVLISEIHFPEPKTDWTDTKKKEN